MKTIVDLTKIAMSSSPNAFHKACDQAMELNCIVVVNDLSWMCKKMKADYWRQS